MSLFDVPDDGGRSYVQDGEAGTGYVEGSSTSKAAHDRALPKAGTRQAAVYDVVDRYGSVGCTSDEIERILNAPHQSISAALRNMELAGLVRRLDRTRTTRWGNEAFVYVTAEWAKQTTVAVLEPTTKRRPK